MARSRKFIVYPAIDLRRGQVVRLMEGDPDRQTHYSTQPAATAQRWLEAGARWLHVVNLDGAFDQPDGDNRAALAEIVQAAAEFEAQVQFGGGLRDEQSIENAFNAGAARVVLGTLLIEQPELALRVLERWGAARITAGLDARDGQVRVRGWQRQAELTLTEAGAWLAEKGFERVVFTDIARDGHQKGVNVEATRNFASQSGLQVIASGGVSSLDDVKAVRAAGLAGVIVGRALYEGTIDAADLFGLPDLAA
jgi:phosphoribosylformimino-5-aminoimidazole carboxamide ribotide isomerase